MKWEKISGHHLSGEGLMSNRHFIKENIQMHNSYKKRCPALLIIKKTHIKIKIRYQLIPVRMAIIKKQRIINTGEDVEELEPYILLIGM